MSLMQTRKRDEITADHPLHHFNLGFNWVPIVYNSNYDISFFKLEQTHPFDSKKWGKVAKLMLEYFQAHNLNFNLISPMREIHDSELEMVHSKKFIKKMSHSRTAIAMACEAPVLILIPISLIRRKLISPLKWQTAGSILAGFVAVKYGWSINIGGGFHHCSAERAEGFCLFADITLMIRYIWAHVNSNLKIMIVDLDAHQGNGYETDALSFSNQEKEKLFIFDMYNESIYPRDTRAREGINKEVRVRIGIQDQDYLKLLKNNLQPCLEIFNPQLIIYNAGTDILEGDRLGLLSISAQGIIDRDEYIFTTSISIGISIVMLTSGGYQKSNAGIIAHSIQNLFAKQIIDLNH